MRVRGALLGLGLLAAGCHHRLPRLAAQGRHAEVVQRAQDSRTRPKKRAARAYAASLHALGRSREALDVLLLDYRRGGHLASLIALADLERALGWRGLAAHHYARVLTHDRDALDGRTEVCGLLRERAREYVSAGEGEAADMDMRRVLMMCGATPQDEALAARADAAAQAQVEARIELGRCEAPCDAAAEAGPSGPSLEQARARSPRAVADLAAQQERQLPPAVIVEQLVAEARGKLGLPLLEDETLRGWVGSQTWSDLAPAVMSASGPVAAYAQLRLADLITGIPRAPGRSGTRELDRWTEQALRIPDALAWRVYAAQGDVATAELALAAAWRKPRPADASPQPERVDHWSQRLEISAGTLRTALVAARLRKAAGKHDLALRLTLRALRDGSAAGLSDVDELGRALAIEALGWGRPWHALALLDSGAVRDPSALRSAAATAVVFSRAMCDGSCREDEDLGVVLRVMGEPWVDQTRAILLDEALARRTRPAASGGCPTVAELIEPGTPGPLAEAVRAAADDLRGPGVGDALATAIASELRSWCAAPIVLPAMVEGMHRLPAERLSDALSHAPEILAAGDLSTQAKLAMVAGQPERAALIAVAAAGQSTTPRAVWLDLGRFAAVAGDRQLELRALREALMVTPEVTDRSIHQRMVLIALEDVALSWGQELPQGQEATRRHVLDFLEPTPREQRWHAERGLIRAVLSEGLARRLEPEPRALLLDALGGEGELARRHPRLLARLRGEDPGPASGVLDDAGLADDARAGRIETVPVLTAALADPRAFEDVRLALATSARDWSVRRSMAISLLVLGSPEARAGAWASLTEMAQASRTPQAQALRELVVQRPASLEPVWGRWAPVKSTVVLEGQETLVRVVLGLDLKPSVVAR